MPYWPDADKRYKSANIRRIVLNLNYKTDADILDVLERQPSMQGYIKSLIRADIHVRADDPKDAPEG